MENRINQIFELADGNKYIVMKQAVYKGENYYVTAKLNEEENEPLEEFTVFKQVEYNNQPCMTIVEDPALVELVCKYVGLLDMENQN